MKFLIDKNLIKLIEEEMLTDYCTQDCYEDETKVWIDIKEIEPMLDELVFAMNHQEEEFAEYKLYVEDNMTHIPIERQLQ